MQINKLLIKNFKGFEDKAFNLNSQFTIFIGDNAKGKTSILDALAISASSFLLGIDVAEKEAKGIEKGQIRIKTIDGDPRPQLPVSIGAEGKVGEVRINWINQINKIKGASVEYYGTREIENIAKNLLKESRKMGGVTFPVLAYHGTGRLWAEHKKVDYKKQEEGVQMAYKNCLSPKSSSKEFLSWYKTYEDEVNKFGQKNDKIMLDAFKEAITSMIPDGHWQDMAFSFKDDDLIGIFTNGDTKEKLLFQQLSDGYRNIIGMVADIAYRCIKLNPHLGKDVIKKTPGIVLIDEIDLHLHPNWQRRIVSDLKSVFPEIQFIATTHSPFIVQSLKGNELRILDEDIKKDGDPFKKSLEEVAADEMGVDDVPRSKKFLEMQSTAEKYYSLIQQGKTSDNDQETKALRDKLNELEKEFGDDPVFVASLKIERKANDL